MILRSLRRFVLPAAVVLSLSLAGCAKNNTTMKEDKNTAAKRWKESRTDLNLQMAQRQFDAEDLDQAEKTLADAMKIYDQDGRLFLLAGRIAMERGQLERASILYNQALKLEPRLHGAHYFLGVVQQRWQQYDKALASYTAAYELMKDNPSYLMAMGEMLIELGKIDDALKLYSDKLVYFDQNAGLRLAIAQIYTMKKDHESAARFTKQAAMLAPDDLRVLEELASCEMRAGHYDKAARNLERLVLEPTLKERRDLRVMLGVAYRKAGQAGLAKHVFHDLTVAEPTDAEAWLALAEVSWELGDPTNTLRAAGQLQTIAPRRLEGYILAGLVWQSRGRVDEALQMFDRAASLAPTSTQPLILRGVALERAGRTAAAIEAYREALKRQPNDEMAARLLATASAE